MKKLLFLFVGSLLFMAGSMAQVQSPDAFLGYQLGTQFTPHWKIVNYINHVAQQSRDMVKVEQYGTTNEGKPLLLAYITSKENMANLESIRQNNLRLANAVTDKMAANEVAPAIVWLSYNVHGNEPSSSEAAMLTLYELVNPSNASTKPWLKNTVVVIDPCLNPDGRDRYVNWYNQTVGKMPNANPNSREHNEPWPQGRSNHYYFDLNRDWAWQTQIESQQRLVKYNQWLPQIHVDFHEQYFNNPYYFAPAAEPFHEVITPWQREFQITIGRNNAKYFDENGWLYFTREQFDLFYPSYGDTYPIYNGSIGMTYEQGGHSRGGLAVIKDDGDTLTLRDRLLHHFTTGLSTIEATSQNAAKVMSEFHQYFNNAVKGTGATYKSYIVKTDSSDRIERLKILLDKNNIEWGYLTTGNTAYSGVGYWSGKTETFKATPGDIAINSNQARSTLVRVLFERTSALSDSVTYDITAWSLPFAYGLNAYAMKGYSAVVKNNPAAAPAVTAVANAYAYAVKWNGLESARFLAAILQKGIRVRYAEQGFKIGNQEFDRGSLIITKAANSKHADSLSALLITAAAGTQVMLYPVTSGFVDKGFDFGSDKIRMIQVPKVAILSGENVASLGLGEIWHFFEQQLGYPVTLLNAADLSHTSANDFNVLIIPNGNYELFSDKNLNDELKGWVRRGGKIIALENAVAQMAKADWGIRLKAADDDKKDDEDKENYALLHKYEKRERDALVTGIPGSIFRVELDNSHPLAFGYPDFYYTLKQDDNIYDFVKEGGWNVGIIKKDNYVAGFTGIKTKTRLQNGLLFGVQDVGRGEVIYLADNPLFRSFWENGKLLFCNAVFMVGQ